MLDFLIGNNFLSAIFAFVIVLIPAVIIHELGHLFAAKAVGITVLEFGIGFPPRVVKLFTWGETEFTLNWIQLGGFVRPLGEDMIRPLTTEETERDRQQVIQENSQRQTSKREQEYLSERDELAARGVINTKSVNEANPYQRIFFMAAGALANFASAFVLFAIIGLIGVPTEVGGRVALQDVPADSMFSAAGLQAGDLIEQVNSEYFADGRALFRQLSEASGGEVSLRVRRLIENAPNEIFETTLRIDPAEAAALSEAEGYVRVSEVIENTPAADAGLRAGDLIAGVNDDLLTDEPDPVRTIQGLSAEYAGQEITLAVLRDGQQMTFTLTPRLNPPPDAGRIGIGIQSVFSAGPNLVSYTNERQQVATVPQPLGEAISYAASRTLNVLRMIAEFPSRLIRGVLQPEEARVVSVVGVSQVGGQLLQDSIQEDEPIIILDYIALISIALGITNLLPIPALDGGRILFVLLEIIRGRPISPEREGLVHLIGLIFLLSVGVIFIINDLVNPLSLSLP